MAKRKTEIRATVIYPLIRLASQFPSTPVSINGAQLQQWEYIGADNQKFKLTSLRAACASDQTGSAFEGRAEMIASRVSTEAFVQQVTLTVDFTQCRGNLRISNLAPITTREYSTAGR